MYACVRGMGRCEAELDAAGAMRLPSLHKFEASYERCQRAFAGKCLGPAKGSNAERLSKAWARARKAFAKVGHRSRVRSSGLVDRRTGMGFWDVYGVGHDQV